MKKNKKDELAVSAVAPKNTAIVPKGTESSHGDDKAKTAAKTATANANGKMTIYEYEEKYVKRQNVKAAKTFLYIFIVFIAVIFIWCLFSISKALYDMHPYAGYAAAAVSVLIFILFYIVPIVKIFRTEHFITNVNYKSAAKAKRHNKKTRYEVASKIVELCNTVAGVGWYDSLTVEKLEAGVKFHDDAVIKEQLTALYTGSVKKSAKQVILQSSLKSAMYSALSQDKKIDTMMIAVVNLQMIKDIIFLYGFRPSETRLVRIFAAVVKNSLVAYGLGGVKIGNGIVRTMGDAVKGLPFLGDIISTVVDSSVQGLANGTLTAVIGFQTIKYLSVEYKLQNILDDVEIAETEEELEATCEEIEKELRSKKRGKATA
ncbi:MAG: YcjF family protein [Candidatus Coproplasma sp.]